MIAAPKVHALLVAALCSASTLAAESSNDPILNRDPGDLSARCAQDPMPSAYVRVASADVTPKKPTSVGESIKTLGQTRLNGPITTQSDHLTSFADGHTELSGNVEIHMGDKEIDADKMVLDRNASSVNVDGKVRFTDPTLEMEGDTGQYSEAAGSALNHARFQFRQQAGYGSAEQIQVSPHNVVTLRRVKYTSCPPPRADWDIRARELRLDTAASVGVGRGAIIDFKGVPVIYVPWISFPLTDTRKSGFLFPDLTSSSRTGVSLAVPWYWNIAPNQDATFTPTIYQQRGAALGAEYRFLSPDTNGNISGEFLPHDPEYGAERNYLRVFDRWELFDNTRVDTNIESVSDTEYFEDFTQGTSSTSTPFLARSVAVGHRDDIWNVRAQFLDFQTLDDTTLAYTDRPYIELPRITASALWSPQRWSELVTGMDDELVDFTRDCPGYVSGCAGQALVNGWRLDAKPYVGLDFAGPGYFFRPNIAWEYTQYELRDDPNDPTLPSDAPQRSLPIVDVDTGLQFERLEGSNGIRSITLEPRVMYVYIPYRDQSQLPVFDSSTPDLNLIELFRPNRYVGIDRIGDSNSVTAGLSTQMFENATGQRYLSATIGQRFYLQDPRVTLPDEPLDSRDTSSLIAEVNLTAYKNWNLQVNVASDPSVSHVDEAEVILQYLASTHQVANVAYRFQQGQLEQIDVNEAWRIGGHWEAYARAVYSLQDHQSIEDFAGFQFRGSCWSIRAVAQRSVTRFNGEPHHDTGVSLQLELTGLSNVGNGVGTGSGLNTFLEQSIRGYSASAPKP